MSKVRRKKLTKEQGLALIEAFQQSGLKSTEFCEQQNIPYYILRHWLSSKDNGSIKNNEACFLPVKLRSSNPILAQTLLRISLNSVISVEIPSGYDRTIFRQILEECYDVVNR